MSKPDLPRPSHGLLLGVLLALVAWLPAREVGATAPAPPRARLLTFFATWCVPCRAELPATEALARRFAGQGLVATLVSVDSPSSAAEIPGFLAQLGIATPWVPDPESELLVRYQPGGSVPFSVLLDEHDRIVYARAGYEPGDEAHLEKAIRTLLDRRSETSASPAGSDTHGASASLAIQGLGLWRHSRFERGDSDLAALVTRFEPRIRYGRHSLALRMDQAVRWNQAAGTAADLRFERIAGDLDLGNVRIRLGDFHVRFGQGMSLSLRRVDPLGTDTALRGGRLDLAIGPARITGIAGVVNPQNFDPVDIRIVPDGGDLVVGAQVEVRPMAALGIAGYFVGARLPDAGPDGRDVDWLIGGGSMGLDFGRIRATVEGAGGRLGGFAASSVTPHGLTGSFAVDLGPTTWLVEGKWYRHWGLGRPDRYLAYDEPATLERADQLVPGNSDSLGGRTRLDWRVIPALTLYANGMAYLFSANGGSPAGGDLAWHVFGGAEVRLGERATAGLGGGWRTERDAAGRDTLRLWHIDVEASIRIGAGLVLSAGLNQVGESRALLHRKDFVRGLSSIGLAWPGVGSIAMMYGHSTEVETRPTHYPGAEIRALLPYGGELRLFGGRMAGGRVCVSGTCRDLPAFEGVRMDFAIHH